jgi:hypothetical protein
VGPTQPRGDYTLRCRLLDPGNGALIAEDVSNFSFE